MTKASVLLVTALVVVISLLARPAGAHTAMLRGSPDRDAIVGGSVDVVDLEFLDPVSQTSVTVTYNGAPLAGQTTVADGVVITHSLDQPLAQPGRYQVSYEMISSDGDFTTGGYFFTFDPVAEQPARIELGSSGLPTTTLVLAAAGLSGLVGLLGLLVWRNGRRRHQPTFAGPGVDRGPGGR